ncbi:murein hydrolase activator EnvC family protein [Microbacterium sulfonylureivorans]|uniref:murein hydrolase activator EnvC family protein n=1 Tax=Microbacterium sulfonylureivorans TaxID=2486854 RepID=UPI000FDBE2F1|nr:M23 family metallopeptidase [Microbacterium sulfonylureivorans]
MTRPSRSDRPSLRRRRRAIAGVVAGLLIAGIGDATGAAHGAPGAPPPSESRPVGRGWAWPLTAFRLEAPFVAPAHRYGPGHRGVDLRPSEGAAVRSPAAGSVAFAGPVAGRGILTIDHGGGLVTTLEPVETALVAGAEVSSGDVVGTTSAGGHAAPGALHFGVRLHGEYINPMLLLGGVPRAVLLPCC